MGSLRPSRYCRCSMAYTKATTNSLPSSRCGSSLTITPQQHAHGMGSFFSGSDGVVKTLRLRRLFRYYP